LNEYEKVQFIKQKAMIIEEKARREEQLINIEKEEYD
jgi:hypothetical protein